LGGSLQEEEMDEMYIRLSLEMDMKETKKTFFEKNCQDASRMNPQASVLEFKENYLESCF
jgi:hypothetical protein